MADDLGALIGAVAQNPAFMDLVKELRGGQEGADDLMEKLPAAIGGIAPMLGLGKPQEREDGAPPRTEPAAGAEDAQAVPPAPDAVVSDRRFRQANAERLLAALKPYLGDRRRGMIDQCVSVLRLTDLLGAAGLLDGHAAEGS